MSTTHQPPHILVVDPSESYRQMLSTTLGADGTVVTFCSTGGEALHFLKNSACNVVVSAMILSDMEGIDLCMQMRAMKASTHIPFVLTTASDSRQAARAALPAGVTEIFNKSAINELVAYVRHFLLSQSDPIQGRVLLIEDNKSQRRMLCEILGHWGLSVVDFETAEEAWPAFEAESFDLVVTDIVLSGVMSGLDFISQIRGHDSSKSEVPILAITGFDDASRRIELFNLGVSDYATKPLIGEELIARVRNLITHWHHRKNRS